MILYINRGTARLALRVREINQTSQLTSWQQLQLLIQPGQWDEDCGPNGSPWILHGCWPGKRTGVDIANPHFDFPIIVYQAYEMDNDGRVVFLLDEKLYALPNGRYTGVLRVMPHVPPFKMSPIVLPKPHEMDIPDEYKIGRNCDVSFPEPPHPPRQPECCILARFDIDLGPECSDHYIDQVTVDMHNGCGVEHGEAH